MTCSKLPVTSNKTEPHCIYIRTSSFKLGNYVKKQHLLVNITSVCVLYPNECIFTVNLQNPLCYCHSKFTYASFISKINVIQLNTRMDWSLIISLAR